LCKRFYINTRRSLTARDGTVHFSLALKDRGMPLSSDAAFIFMHPSFSGWVDLLHFELLYTLSSCAIAA